MSSVSRRHFIQVNLLKNGTSAIVEDARLPNKYRMLISTVDVIFADVAQPDQARIVIHNAQYFLKDGGHVVISIKASCVDSTIAPSAVFTQEVQTLRAGKLKPIAQITLEPYERDHAMVTGKHGVLSGMRMMINPVRSSIPSPPVGLSWGFCCKNAAVYTKCCLLRYGTFSGICPKILHVYTLPTASYEQKALVLLFNLHQSRQFHPLRRKAHEPDTRRRKTSK